MGLALQRAVVRQHGLFLTAHHQAVDLVEVQLTVGAL